MKKNKSRSGLAFFTLSVPAAILYLIFVLVPIFNGVVYSFTDWNGLAKTKNFNGFGNYIEMLQDERTFHALWLTLKYTFISGAIILVLSFCLALLINRNIKFQKTFRAIYFFPAVMSMVVVGMIFYNIYQVPLPALGQKLGIEILSNNLISSDKTALTAVVIPSVWQGLAIPFVIFIAGLQGVPSELLEAASIDGASKLKQLWYITIPYMIPTIQIVIVLLLRNGITAFDYVQVVTNGGPGYATETVPLMIYKNAFAKGNLSYAMAQAVLLLIIMCVLSMIQIKILGRKEVDQL